MEAIWNLLWYFDSVVCLEAADCGSTAEPYKSPGHTHLTLAATEDIASLLRFFLLDTAVPMLKWTRSRRENADHSTD